ncbi:MAG: quinolinate synthase NadA [Phycisphaerae bacterium]|nr:quinolinate synthase NadA [Phycisphaerae bacterium]
MLFQPPLPSRYAEMTQEQMADEITRRRRAIGRRLVILGHHYERDEVLRFADFTGDSLKLSQIAAEQTDAEFVVFCGVHFMAESADILTDDSVRVILPDISAGCSMADMADLDQLEEAWRFLADATTQTIAPITYVNSAATIKAFCGRHGGACCTSGNAQPILEWALKHGDKVIFLPDQHLGRNTAYAMGINLSQMVLYDPELPDGGLSTEQARSARIILWKGYCSVHSLFTVEQCDHIRRVDPDCRIVVHPECPWEVVQKADLAGSTEFIIKAIAESPAGSRWAVGTETHLVNRLAGRHLDKQVRSLAGVQCLCTTMYRIDLGHLLWVLDELSAGRMTNRVIVPPDVRDDALVALERMLKNVPSQPQAAKPPSPDNSPRSTQRPQS